MLNGILLSDLFGGLYSILHHSLRPCTCWSKMVSGSNHSEEWPLSTLSLPDLRQSYNWGFNICYCFNVTLPIYVRLPLYPLRANNKFKKLITCQTHTQSKIVGLSVSCWEVPLLSSSAAWNWTNAGVPRANLHEGNVCYAPQTNMSESCKIKTS